MASPSSRNRALLALAATLLVPLVVLRTLVSLLPADATLGHLLAGTVSAAVFAVGVKETRRLVRESRRGDGD